MNPQQLNLDFFAKLLRQRTGLNISDNEQEKACHILENRLRELRFNSTESYYQFLNEGSVKAEQEWQTLVELLTILESFFLRDKGQIKILKEQILPDLIQRNRSSRRLKIWSAGCSTGEEPYSLALLIQKLIPDYHNWDILILGSDINTKALAKAESGLYSKWSLRDVEADVLSHFTPAEKGLFALDPAIKNRVNFRQLNLLQAPFPDYQINEIDLILCRNVFIYFTPQAITQVIEKFTHTLKAGGYLITGHGELYQQNLQGLKSHVFVESVVYQKHHDEIFEIIDIPEQPELPSLTLTETLQPSTLEATGTSSQATPVNTDLSPEEHYAKSIQSAENKILDLLDFDANYELAKSYANSGQYPIAEKHLQAAMNINSLNGKPYYLLSQVKELQNDREQAKELLQKVIYLTHDFIPAYLDLAVLHQQQGETQKAAKMRANALHLLKKRPADEYLEDCEAKVSDIIRHLS
ncbi:MAG: hypothetical protein GQ569_13135 [Methylococcaceae bacterium]|nr:hypothetical protein [Methylococcaceae bacterium]